MNVTFPGAWRNGFDSMTRTSSRNCYCPLLLCMASLLACLGASAAESAVQPSRLFAFDCAENILDEEHFGIINGRMTAGINYRSLGSISGLFAPPYVSSDFRFTCTVDGQPMPRAGTSTWWPNAVHLAGEGAACDTWLPYGERSLLVELTFDAPNGDRDLALAGEILGTLDVNQIWEFAQPKSESPVTRALSDNVLVLEQGEQVLAIASDRVVAWNLADFTWACSLRASSGQPATIRFAISIGPRDAAVEACSRLLTGASRDKNLAELDKRIAQYLAPLPRFTCDNKELEQLYYRSLAHGFLNRWEVPEFKLNPYYSTGSVNGGCVCNYLWDFGEVWEMMPLLDAEALKTHVKQFLSIDLIKHFAFLPVAGDGFGPWYMVNQEKIIGLVYYYILATGDTAFLDETVAGQSVLDWMLFHATVLDDVSKPVALIDYGPSKSHLELRREYMYNHVMPDLNGRRYNNYVFAARLSERMGKPRPDLLERAEQLKVLLHRELWDPQTRWFPFLNERGEKELRYTCQMFKLFNSKVLTPESEAGLLSHLNTTEFLGEYGLHSLSKLDPAYDPADVDNGGPGACTSFPPQIAERLYKSGHAPEADDLLRRILWWGQRMPYWGDSIVANHPEYRKDTPLQCILDGLTVAQCLIFGMLGITPHFDGSVTVDPHVPPFVKTMSLENIRLGEHNFALRVHAEDFEVTEEDRTLRSPLGTPITLSAANP